MRLEASCTAPLFFRWHNDYIFLPFPKNYLLIRRLSNDLRYPGTMMSKKGVNVLEREIEAFQTFWGF